MIINFRLLKCNEACNRKKKKKKKKELIVIVDDQVTIGLNLEPLQH